jgi:hypothetical protein
MLELHPDKNAGNAKAAADMFQCWVLACAMALQFLELVDYTEVIYERFAMYPKIGMALEIRFYMQTEGMTLIRERKLQQQQQQREEVIAQEREERVQKRLSNAQIVEHNPQEQKQNTKKCKQQQTSVSSGNSASEEVEFCEEVEFW